MSRWMIIALAAAALAGCKKTEPAPPGSPEYETWMHGLVVNCVRESEDRDLNRSRAEVPVLPTAREYYAQCRQLLEKTTDRFPGSRPRRPARE